MTQTIETVWPDDSFAQFGGHVLQRLFEVKDEMASVREKRYRVRVTIEIDPMPLAPAKTDSATVAGVCAGHTEDGGRESGDRSRGQYHLR
jgi:hypothetical protein